MRAAMEARESILQTIYIAHTGCKAFFVSVLGPWTRTIGRFIPFDAASSPEAWLARVKSPTNTIKI